MPERVATTAPEGLDYGWIMQVTFVAAIVVGAPVVAALALFVDLPTWGDRLTFAIQVGAVVWLTIAIAVYGYARRRQ